MEGPRFARKESPSTPLDSVDSRFPENPVDLPDESESRDAFPRVCEATGHTIFPLEY